MLYKFSLFSLIRNFQFKIHHLFDVYTVTKWSFRNYWYHWQSSTTAFSLLHRLGLLSYYTIIDLLYHVNDLFSMYSYSFVNQKQLNTYLHIITYNFFSKWIHIESFDYDLLLEAMSA